jgi:hypothetical protein
MNTMMPCCPACTFLYTAEPAQNYDNLYRDCTCNGAGCQASNGVNCHCVANSSTVTPLPQPTIYGRERCLNLMHAVPYGDLHVGQPRYAFYTLN